MKYLRDRWNIFADLYMEYLDDFKCPRELKDGVRANIIKEYR